MIIIKDKVSINKMETAGKLLSEIFNNMDQLIFAGNNTLEIDSWIEKQLRKNDMIPKSKGYAGYQHSSCISINDEVVHGIPSLNKVLTQGDLVKIDVCASWKNYCADMARCFFVGNVSNGVKKLVSVAQNSLDKGIAQALPGNRLSDISWAIQKEVEDSGFGVVRDFAGHGIGKQMHEEPEILNYGKPGIGPILKEGMTFAIEPMITAGNYEVYITTDGWTVKTKDKSLAAHVEDTILITKSGPKILTRSIES